VGVVNCVACGYAVNDQATACPDCGADPHTGEGGGHSATAVTFLSARYLGHHPELQKGRDEQREGRLRVTPEWIELLRADGRPRGEASMSLPDVESVEVLGGRVTKGAGDIAKSVLVSGLAFAEYKTDRTTLVMHLKSGEAAYFEVDEQRPASLRVAIESILAAAGVPFLEDVAHDVEAEGAPGAGVHSVADELAKLAQLRDSGVLTEDEFATLKARLIG
jgi:hypothetical protein